MNVEDPASLFDLPAQQVHCWWWPLAGTDTEIGSAARLLSAEERARAARFHRPRDRGRYAIARGTLRRLLARYTGGPAAALPLTLAPAGKPRLASRCATGELGFNLSHSGDVAFVAIAWNAEVGADVERHRPLDDLFTIAGGALAEAEIATLRALPAQQRTPAFFDCWTRKESVAKAHGAGLGLPLEDFAVSCMPGQPAALLSSAAPIGDRDDWSLFAPRIMDGYSFAVAVRGPAWAFVDRGAYAGSDGGR